MSLHKVFFLQVSNWPVHHELLLGVSRNVVTDSGLRKQVKS